MIKVFRKLDTINALSQPYHYRIAQLKGPLETDNKDCDAEIGDLQLAPYIETPKGSCACN